MLLLLLFLLWILFATIVVPVGGFAVSWKSSCRHMVLPKSNFHSTTQILSPFNYWDRNLTQQQQQKCCPLWAIHPSSNNNDEKVGTTTVSQEDEHIFNEEIKKINNNNKTTIENAMDRMDWEKMGIIVFKEVDDIVSSFINLINAYYILSDETVTPEAIVILCDELDNVSNQYMESHQIVSRSVRQTTLQWIRYELLVKLMRKDYNAYLATASFLCPRRIAREDLPNVQDVGVGVGVVPMHTSDSINGKATITSTNSMGTDVALVPDCELDNITYKESILDKVLLHIFRKQVEQYTGGIQSSQPGIVGLVEQGRTFMLQPNQTPEQQHTMVRNTLAALMTPALPPFYRIFMSGIVPFSSSTTTTTNPSQQQQQQQYGPWWYAPYLTTIVTSPLFGFLVGPSHVNRRRDGQMGGLLVEKCKFLQESNCKGMCLHQCKLPAQQFFDETLGMPLSVQPNFVTQECQWNFGETPVPIDKDTTFPQGCLVGCVSRQTLTTMEGEYRNLCN